MKNSINLALNTKPEKIENTPVVKILYGVFAVVFVLGVVSVGINLAMSLQHAGLKKKEKSLVEDILKQDDKRKQLLHISERSRNITTVLGARGNINVKLATLAQAFPDDVSITSIQSNGDEITMEVRSNSLLTMDTLLEGELKDFLKTNKLGISLVDINKFSAESGVYTLAMRFSFKGEK